MMKTSPALDGATLLSLQLIRNRQAREVSPELLERLLLLGFARRAETTVELTYAGKYQLSLARRAQDSQPPTN